MFIGPIAGVDNTAKLQHTLMPIVWVDEGILLNEEMVNLLKETLINRLVLVDVLHWVLFGGGLAIFVIFGIWYLATRNSGTARM